MNYNQLACGLVYGNTGLQKCSEDLGTDSFAIIVPSGTEIATLADAIDLAKWVLLVNQSVDDRAYPMSKAFNIEYATDEAQYVTGVNGQKELFMQSVDRIRYIMPKMSQYNKIAIRNCVNGKTGLAMYRVTKNGYILGYSLDDTKLLPFDLSNINAENDKFDVADVNRLILECEFANSDQWNKYGVAVKPAWNPIVELFGIKDVKLVASNVTATGCKITVTGASDNLPYDGLVKADFKMYSLLGVAVTITTVTDNTDGSYAFVYPEITTAHEIDLVNQPAMTAKNIESVEAATLTV